MEWTSKQPDRLWREYTDRLQIALIDRWLEDSVGHTGDAPLTALKTDLFDEVAGRGIVRHLTGRGYHTTGIDIAPVVVAEALRRNPGLHACCADVRDLPFADASFNVVFSGSTLDHFATVADIAQAVKELVRVLRPSGRLLLTLDNPLNPLVSLRNGPLLRLFRRSGIVPYQVGATLGPGSWPASFARAASRCDRPRPFFTARAYLLFGGHGGWKGGSHSRVSGSSPHWPGGSTLKNGHQAL